MSAVGETVVGGVVVGEDEGVVGDMGELTCYWADAVRAMVPASGLPPLLFLFASIVYKSKDPFYPMRFFLAASAFVLLCLSGTVLAQATAPAVLVPEVLSSDDMVMMDTLLDSVLQADGPIPPQLQPPPAVLPLMSSELALQSYQARAARQATGIASYTATSVIHAELPETKQQGEYEVKRQYSAPKSLLFTALHFTGDTFVKANVITRLLQSEVDHVQKEDGPSMALSAANYKFSYKGLQVADGRTLHGFQLKPRKRRLGLLKGNMYLDAHTGSLVRVEGVPAKSPSVFLSKIRLIQDFADFGPFTLPVHIHSEAKASIVGRTIVDVYQRDYQVVPGDAQTARVTVPTE